MQGSTGAPVDGEVRTSVARVGAMRAVDENEHLDPPTARDRGPAWLPAVVRETTVGSVAWFVVLGVTAVLAAEVSPWCALLLLWRVVVVAVVVLARRLRVRRGGQVPGTPGRSAVVRWLGREALDVGCAVAAVAILASIEGPAYWWVLGALLVACPLAVAVTLLVRALRRRPRA